MCAYEALAWLPGLQVRCRLHYFITVRAAETPRCWILYHGMIGECGGRASREQGSPELSLIVAPWSNIMTLNCADSGEYPGGEVPGSALAHHVHCVISTVNMFERWNYVTWLQMWHARDTVHHSAASLDRSAELTPPPVKPWVVLQKSLSPQSEANGWGRKERREEATGSLFLSLLCHLLYRSPSVHLSNALSCQQRWEIQAHGWFSNLNYAMFPSSRFEAGFIPVLSISVWRLHLCVRSILVCVGVFSRYSNSLKNMVQLDWRL